MSPLTEKQGSILGALIQYAPAIVMQIIQLLRDRGHSEDAGYLERLLAGAKADYLTVINVSREERGLPPLTQADLDAGL